MGELGVIGKIAIASLKRKATDAAASLPSTVILLLDVSHPFYCRLPIANCRVTPLLLPIADSNDDSP
jgi:hypothetical protein